MSNQTIACPHCQKRYRLQVSETKVVQCSQCQQKFRVHPPQPVAAQPVVAQPLEAQVVSQPGFAGSPVSSPLQSRRGSSVQKPEPPGMGAGPKLLIIGLAVGFLLLMVGLAALLWFLLGDKNVDMASGAHLKDAVAVAPEFDSTSDRSSGDATKKNTTASGDIAYDFIEGNRYVFQYNFETELGKKNVLKMSGSNYLTKLPRGDLPIQVEGFGGISGGKSSGGDRQVLQSRTFAMTESKSSNDPYRFSSPRHEHFEGTVELDSASQPKAVKGRLNSNLLPLLYQPMSRLGIEPLPPSGAKTWKEERDVITVRIKESADPGSRFGALMGPGFGGISRHSPYGYPGRRPEASDADVTTLKRIEKFVVESQDATQLRVSKTLSITPQETSDDGPQITVQAKGFYVFDKIKNCVVESELTGTAELVAENVTVKIPVKYTTSLSSVKTKADLAADREKRDLERKKEKEELNRKSKEMVAKGGSGDSSKPLKFAAIEAGDDHVPNETAAEFQDLGWGVDSLAFSPTGILYAGKMDRSILVFNFEKRKRIDEVTKLEDLGQVKVTAVSPNGKYLLTGGYSGRIEVWELRDDGTLKDSEAFVGHSKEIKSITISADSKLAISGGREERARLWDIETRKEIAVFDGFERSVLATYIAQDSSYALATDGNNLMKIDLKTNKIVSNPKVFKSYPHAAAFTPDGKKLALSKSYDVHIIDTTSFVEEMELEGPRSIHHGLAFDKSGQYLFAGGRHITQWDWANGEAVNEYHLGDHATIRSIAITDDGKHLASIGSSAGQDLRVFKIRNDAGE